MFVTVDERDARPLYQQLVDEIKTLIARGELEEGTLLPPVRQVASYLGVNLNTVAFAYRRLQKDGLIRVKHGSGAVVISQTLKEKPDDRLRTQLRTALTQLILAGLKQSEISALLPGDGWARGGGDRPSLKSIHLGNPRRRFSLAPRPRHDNRRCRNCLSC